MALYHRTWNWQAADRNPLLTDTNTLGALGMSW
jgi:hypothetical protein